MSAFTVSVCMYNLYFYCKVESTNDLGVLPWVSIKIAHFVLFYLTFCTEKGHTNQQKKSILTK